MTDARVNDPARGDWARCAPLVATHPVFPGKASVSLAWSRIRSMDISTSPKAVSTTLEQNQTICRSRATSQNRLVNALCLTEGAFAVNLLSDIHLLYRTDKRLTWRACLSVLAFDWPSEFTSTPLCHLNRARSYHLTVGLAKLNSRETVRRW
jgi:hypothetical protein